MTDSRFLGGLPWTALPEIPRGKRGQGITKKGSSSNKGRKPALHFACAERKIFSPVFFKTVVAGGKGMKKSFEGKRCRVGQRRREKSACVLTCSNHYGISSYHFFRAG